MSNNTEMRPLHTLVSLGHDIIDDDTYRQSMAQAEPAYYGILEKHKVVCPYEYDHDGIWILAKNDFEYPQELSDAIVEYLTAEDAGTDWDESYLADRRTHEQRMHEAKKAINMESASDEDVIDAIKESNWNAFQVAAKLDLGETVAYQTVEKLRTDSLALTHKGIMQTYNLNGHNFKKPNNTYAMTAIRSPEIRDLKLALRKLAALSDSISPVCSCCKSKTNLSDIDINDGITTLTFTCPSCDKVITKHYSEVEQE